MRSDHSRYSSDTGVSLPVEIKVPNKKQSEKKSNDKKQFEKKDIEKKQNEKKGSDKKSIGYSKQLSLPPPTGSLPSSDRSKAFEKKSLRNTKTENRYFTL